MKGLRCLLIVGLASGLQGLAQVSITTGSYMQNFGVVDITSWTNNSTYPGWYHNQASFAGHVNITASAPVNTGGFYSYECSGANDQKIGSRGSGTATTVRYGVVLRNQTGSPIMSLRVRYRGYQMSLAENGNNVNSLTFDYVVSAGIPAIGAAATASVPALNFTQLQSSSVNGSNQINGYPCNQSALVSSCINLAAPLGNNSYILLRWTDIDNAANDPHLAIDDVQVDFDLTGTGCTLLLPIELLEFEARAEREAVRLEWATGSERDNDYFIVERSADGTIFGPIAVVPGMGNSYDRVSYEALDIAPISGTSYYRLRQMDRNGTWSFSPVEGVYYHAPYALLRILPTDDADGEFKIIVQDALVGGAYAVVDASGHKLEQGYVPSSQFTLRLGAHGTGVFIVRVTTGARTASARCVVSVP